jgi:4'-phosphopantetheinyl transferase
MMKNIHGKTTDKTLQIWKIHLDDPNAAPDQLFTLLDEDEKKNALHFRFEKHRRRYITSHAAMRNILAEQLNIPIPQLNIRLHENGKPYLLTNPLHFNLSHSEELAVLAISFQGDVGIDVEHIKPDVNALEITKRFFHPLEFEQLQKIPPEKRQDYFYLCWTGKEAYVKTKGLGIANHLKAFALDFTNMNALKIIFANEEVKEFKDWHVQTFQPSNHYLSTIVSTITPSEVIFHNYHFTTK